MDYLQPIVNFLILKIVQKLWPHIVRLNLILFTTLLSFHQNDDHSLAKTSIHTIIRKTSRASHCRHLTTTTLLSADSDQIISDPYPNPSPFSSYRCLPATTTIFVVVVAAPPSVIILICTKTVMDFSEEETEKKYMIFIFCKLDWKLVGFFHKLVEEDMKEANWVFQILIS